MKPQILVLVYHTEDGYDLVDYQPDDPARRGSIIHRMIIDSENEDRLEFSRINPEEEPDLQLTVEGTELRLVDRWYFVDGVEGLFVHVVPPDKDPG